MVLTGPYGISLLPYVQWCLLIVVDLVLATFRAYGNKILQLQTRGVEGLCFITHTARISFVE